VSKHREDFNKSSEVKRKQKEKKSSKAMQTLRAGCSKADPQTNTQTDRADYNTLCSLACSVTSQHY